MFGRWFGGGKAVKPSDQLRVAELCVYPIKSCRGFSVDRWNFTLEGLEYDRQWMIVSDERHRFVTAREHPKMLLIETAIDLDASTGPQLVITLPATSSRPSSTYSLPVEAPPNAPYSADYTIWQSPPCDGYDVGDSNGVNDALSEYLGFRVCLILKGPEPRTCGYDFAVEALNLPLAYDVEDERTLPTTDSITGKQAATRWADGYPFLLTTRESEKDVQKMISDPCNISVKGWDSSKWGAGGSRTFHGRRFRANIISEGANAAWEEDGWLEVKVGSQAEERWSTLFPVSRCGRCMVPNTDPETAERDAVVPFNIMKPTRAVGETTSHGPCFGVNAIPESATGTIAVGDSLYVLRRCSLGSDGVWQRPEDDRAVAAKRNKESAW